MENQVKYYNMLSGLKEETPSNFMKEALQSQDAQMYNKLRTPVNASGGAPLTSIPGDKSDGRDDY